MSIQRGQVLSLYKRILRLGQVWASKEPEDTKQDQIYIRHEARTLFRQNKHLADTKAIGDAIQEAEARMEIGKIKISYNIVIVHNLQLCW